LTKKNKFLSRTLYHFFVFIELSIRLIIIGWRINPKIIHCHDTLVLPIGVLLKTIRRSKLIYDAHELESNKAGQTKILSKLTLIIEKICWPYIDLLITVSPSIVKWYMHNFGKKKAELILNAPYYDRKQTTNEKKYFHNKYNIPDSSQVFLYLGLLEPGRGIEKLIDIFKNSKAKSHIVLMGHGSLKSFIQNESNNTMNIHYHQTIPHEQVVQVSQSANIGLCMTENVSLSDYYCLPNKLFEYVFAGLPVVASKFPDIEAYVKMYNLGKCCNTNSIDEMFQTILQIEEVPLSKVSSNLSSLSWQNQSLKLIRAYKELDSEEGGNVVCS